MAEGGGGAALLDEAGEFVESGFGHRWLWGGGGQVRAAAGGFESIPLARQINPRPCRHDSHSSNPTFHGHWGQGGHPLPPEALP